MFVPVGCSECGKLFQVERGQLGQPASCPWCQARVVALPVAAKSPEPLPLPEPIDREPAVVMPVRRRRSRSRKRTWFLLVALCVLIAGGTFLVQRFRGGGMPPFVMQKFSAPDGSCQATLPGSASLVEGPQFTTLQSGSSLFAASSWFTRITGGLGWIDLDAERAKMVRSDDLFTNVRDELGRWLGEPTVDKEGLVKSGTAEGMEIRYGTGGKRFMARMILVLDAPQPRMYLVWVGGPGFNPDGELGANVLTSFRLTPPGK